MLNYYFKDSIDSFLQKSHEEIIGSITLANQFDSTLSQNKSWDQQITILKKSLVGYQGTVFFEFSIPRMGKRVDTIIIIDNVVFVVEFKVGESSFLNSQIDQVWDYALDLKNFHKPSHHAILSPILVATEAKNGVIGIVTTSLSDGLILPIKIGKEELAETIRNVLQSFKGDYASIDGQDYANGNYSPTPTIIEAALSLYNSHAVDEITRNDAEAKNLKSTTSSIAEIIIDSKQNHKKVICFVTGVPGAGKTLVGLKVATSRLDDKSIESVYLSGNGPLVAILQEALARDKVKRELILGNKITKREAKQAVKSFIQIVHHYRDAYLVNPDPPYDHVAIFDEAQRAWNKEQTIKFMRQKKNRPDFNYSEPEFLISCLDRHKDWAVVVCLVGGGQEINVGEGGISEWLDAVQSRFTEWQVCISPNLIDSEYNAAESIKRLQERTIVKFNSDLHLGISMRSFRSENLSLFIKNILDLDLEGARKTFLRITENYPIVLTRNLTKAKRWLKEKARGTERYGIVVSSQAQRLKPLAIDVKSPIDPVNWFLEGKDDVRSSFFLEDVATEFHVQGLELDWSCVTWDGDLRYSNNGWQTFSFKGNKWQNINNLERKKYLINAYRVLLTRARQGMVIVVPEGNNEDHTRKSDYYDSTFNYLAEIGISII